MAGEANNSPSGGGRKARRSRMWWWLAGGVTGLIVLLVGGALAYWLAGQTYWTDDESIRIRQDRAHVRYVLWTNPKPLPGPLNSPDQDYEPTLSPDGKELYFVRGLPGKDADIYVSLREERGWSEPKRLRAVNTEYDELGPRLTPDGRFLMFYSDRPGGCGQHDIWAAERTQSGWGRPFNLGPNVNSPWNEYGPTCGPDGRLYFATDRKAAARQKLPWRATIRQRRGGDYDLFVAEPLERPTTGPTSRPAGPATSPARSKAGARPAPPLAFRPARELQGVNTPYHEGACCITPRGDFLYFASDRPGGLGGFDLYRCRLGSDGTCGPVENLGPEVNTPDNEADPQLTMQGFRMVFSSDRAGQKDIYDLFMCESREVYARRVPRAAPNLGWPIWVLLASLAVLIPLMLFLKAGGYRHLSLLQKCAFVSLMVHLVMILLFSVWEFSKPILIHIAKEAGMTVAVNLEISRAFEVGQQIRQQVTDIPVADAAPADLVKAEPIPLPRAVLQPTKINVPKVSRRPAAMTIQPEAPRKVTPRPTEHISLPPPPVVTELPQLRLTPPEPIAEAEATPVAPRPEPPQLRPRPVKVTPAQPKVAPTAMKAQPARPKVHSLIRSAEAKPAPRPVPERLAPQLSPPPPAQPQVTGPDLKARPLAELPAALQPPEPVVSAPRAVQSAPLRLRATEVHPAAGRAAVAARSLLRPRPALAEMALLVEAPPPRPRLPEQAAPAVTGPRTAAPVRAAERSADLPSGRDAVQVQPVQTSTTPASQPAVEMHVAPAPARPRRTSRSRTRCTAWRSSWRWYRSAASWGVSPGNGGPGIAVPTAWPRWR